MANVPENYVAKIKKGDSVQVVVKELDTTFSPVINMIGGSIDPVTRSFMAEAKLPSLAALKPNQIATMKILDYKARAAVTIKINLVQSDEKSKYVYVAEKSGDKTIARKKTVTVGEAYNGLIEIKSGLSGGEVIITEGFQSVYDGQAIRTNK